VSYTINISFNLGKEYEFTLHDADIQDMGAEEARAWLLSEFQEMECVPSSPSGKILLLDMILNVALYGEERFEGDVEWARNYARAVAASLQRPAITVDVSNFVVG